MQPIDSDSPPGPLALPLDALGTTTLTKAEIAEHLHLQIGFNKREAKDLVEFVFEAIGQRLIAGEDVRISGFGNFVLRNKRARPGRNPRTGESIEIEPRRVVTFQASQKLREQI